MTTFSQAVDKIVLEAGRRDMRDSIVTWMNQTIRDVHAANIPGTQAMPVKFAANLQEDEIIATVDNGHLWAIPNQTRHQFLIAAYYPEVDKYAHIVTPGSINLGTQEVDAEFTVYRTGNFYSFGGYGATGSTIRLAWYEFPRRLIYYSAGVSRPVEYEDDTQLYTYQLPWSNDILPDDKAAALDLSTNWLLERWEDLILQGTRSKLYNRTDDSNRAKSSYSAYMEQRPVMIATESMEFIGFYRG